MQKAASKPLPVRPWVPLIRVVSWVTDSGGHYRYASDEGWLCGIWDRRVVFKIHDAVVAAIAFDSCGTFTVDYDTVTGVSGP